MKSIFLQKSYLKYVGETICRPFSKKSKWRSQNGASSGSVALFLLYVKVIAIEIYWNQAVEQIELI